MNTIVFDSVRVCKSTTDQGDSEVPRVWETEYGIIARFKGADVQGYGEKAVSYAHDFVAYGEAAKWLCSPKTKLRIGSRLYVVGRLRKESFNVKKIKEGDKTESVVRDVIEILNVSFASNTAPPQLSAEPPKQDVSGSSKESRSNDTSKSSQKPILKEDAENVNLDQYDPFIKTFEEELPPEEDKGDSFDIVVEFE